MIVTPRTPSGFSEYSPSEQIEFNRLIDIIRSTYESYGFSPIDTPDLELSDVLLAKGGGETDQQIYRFTHGRNDLSMRFDLTVPLARYAAEHESELVFPFRRYQIGKVHRAERAQAGRYREFYQCDIDVLGSTSPIVDAEFPMIINKIFDTFGFGEFTIRINNRKILNGFFDGLGIDNRQDVMRIIDKIEKISLDDLVSSLSNIGLDRTQTDSVIAFTQIKGTNDEILQQLSSLKVASDEYHEGVTKLNAVISALNKMGMPDGRYKIELKIARGLDYYTGTVFETILNDHPGLGSVCSGGRYDDLASHYTKTKLPGVGISIGLSRLFYKLVEAGMINPVKQSPAEIVVIPMADEQILYSLKVAAQLRSDEYAVLHYSESQNIQKKLRYADRMGFKWAILTGEREEQSHTVSLKNMITGDSQDIAVDNITDAINIA